ncbi:hypothetical protein [Actinacidiphila yanglinensis]
MVDEWEAVTPGTVERMSARIPMGGMGEPREIAEAAAWLLSDRGRCVRRTGAPDRGGIAAGA